MPRVHTQKARKDIYQIGKRVLANTKSGTKIDRSQPKDENDKVLIPAGSTYYKWSFRNGGTHRSLSYPSPSQLTQSVFYQPLYSMIEDFQSNHGTDKESILESLESLISEAETLRDEQEEKRDNMPESLQESPTGELLQERFDAIEEWISDLEDFKTEIEDIEDEDSLEDLLSDLPECNI